MEGMPDITDVTICGAIANAIADVIICGVIANSIADAVIHQYHRRMDRASKETNPCQARALRIKAVRIKWIVYKEAHEKSAGIA